MAPKSGLLNPLVPASVPRGKLFIVATPIGNLEDITLRAIRTLKEVDLIACEDTRRTQKLLNHYDIRTRTVSYHQHNEMTRAPELIIEMEQGRNIALVTDAGMPVISDPGYRLIHLAIRHGIPVTPVPGTSAFVAALAVAGLPVDRFRFLGFLPARKAARRKALEELKGASNTLVFYEAPHRIVDLLKDLHVVLGEREVVVAREVTKIHEEFLRGSTSQILTQLKKKPVKGELTVVVGSAIAQPAKAAPLTPIKNEISSLMQEKGLTERAALKVVARARGLSRSQAYRQLQMEKSSEQGG